MRKLSPFLFVGLFFSILYAPGSSWARSVEIRQLSIATTINPVTASFITEQIEQANRQNNRAILIQLDTPGGLDSAMREIIQAELGSKIPVIVYVAPKGARAASAGTLITMAADFAAMAPGTNIGAAHPVAIGGDNRADNPMVKKALNDAAAYARSLAQQRGRNQDWAEAAVRKSVSISAEEAVTLAVVDLIADNPQSLLNKLAGYRYIRNGKALVFNPVGAELVPVEMNWRQKILSTIGHPNIAYMLLILGILGIFFEIAQPGMILPGVIGTIAILLAFFALSTLPVNYVGVLLILLAFVLFVLEIKVTSYGMLSIGGVVAMAFGSLILIDSSEPYLQISRGVIAATVTVTTGFFLFAVSMVVKTQRRPVVSGQEGMIGETGTVVKAINRRGSVLVHGEYWQAHSDEPIAAGTEVEVVRFLRGLELEVKIKTTSPQRTEDTED